MTKTYIHTCPICGRKTRFVLDADLYEEYMDGEISSHEAFASLSEAERMTIVSGLCPTCLDKALAHYDNNED